MLQKQSLHFWTKFSKDPPHPEHTVTIMNEREFDNGTGTSSRTLITLRCLQRNAQGKISTPCGQTRSSRNVDYTTESGFARLSDAAVPVLTLHHKTGTHRIQNTVVNTPRRTYGAIEP